MSSSPGRAGVTTLRSAAPRADRPEVSKGAVPDGGDEGQVVLVVGACLLFGAPGAALVWLATQGLGPLAAVMGVILAGLATWVVVPEMRSRRRDQEVTRWASTHGWRRDGRLRGPVIGGSEVLLRAVRGVPITSCATVYESDWRRGLDTTRFRHVVMTSLPAALPVLTITPTGGVRRAPAGPDDGPARPLEWAEFNDSWNVQCEDPQFAHAFCHPRLMERLMAEDASGMSVLVAGPDIAVHAPGRTDLDALDVRVALLADLVELVPRFLVEDHAAPQPQGRRPAPTIYLRGAVAGEATGWPTIVMTAIMLAAVGWFVVTMARAGAVDVALGTVTVVLLVGAIPFFGGRAARRRRKAAARSAGY